MQGLESRDHVWVHIHRFLSLQIRQADLLHRPGHTTAIKKKRKKICIEPLNFCLSYRIFLRKTRILDLKRSNHGESITYPGKLFQRLITLTVKNLYLISNLNFSGSSFQPLDLVMPLSAQLKNTKASDTVSICRCLNTEISVAGSHEGFGGI